MKISFNYPKKYKKKNYNKNNLIFMSFFQSYYFFENQ